MFVIIINTSKKGQNTKIAYNNSRPSLVQKDNVNFPNYLTGNLKFKGRIILDLMKRKEMRLKTKEVAFTKAKRNILALYWEVKIH